MYFWLLWVHYCYHNLEHLKYYRSFLFLKMVFLTVLRPCWDPVLHQFLKLPHQIGGFWYTQMTLPFIYFSFCYSMSHHILQLKFQLLFQIHLVTHWNILSIFLWNILKASTAPNGSLAHLNVPNWHAKVIKYEDFIMFDIIIARVCIY